jgi:hypothetical protein
MADEPKAFIAAKKSPSPKNNPEKGRGKETPTQTSSIVETVSILSQGLNQDKKSARRNGCPRDFAVGKWFLSSFPMSLAGFREGYAKLT